MPSWQNRDNGEASELVQLPLSRALTGPLLILKNFVHFDGWFELHQG